MRVKVELSLDVDVDAWIREYGVERRDVRRDVQTHATQSLKAHFGDLGLLEVDR